MADKSFGVKELNLIGGSGVPTIESPNNLNLNANQVAISADVSIGGVCMSDFIMGPDYSITANSISAAGVSADATYFNIRNLPTNVVSPQLPSVGNVFIVDNDQSTQISNIQGGSAGQIIILVGEDANTNFSHGDTAEGGFLLNGAVSFSDFEINSTLTLVHNRASGGNARWIEVSRSVNS